MHLLLTNDDGIASTALHSLAERLAVEHTVLVVVPEDEQSGVSHAFSYKKTITVKEKKEYNYACYTVSGTPADCVKFAYFKLLGEQKPDLVISGINDGHNTGVGCFYSGTVGGAREGILLGIPSVAVSIQNHSERNIKAGVEWVVEFLDSESYTQMTPESIWNVNIPDVDTFEIKGIEFCAMSTVMYHDTYILESDTDGKEYSLKGHRPEDQFVEGTDDYLVTRGYVTIVPLKTDQSDYDFLELNREL